MLLRSNKNCPYLHSQHGTLRVKYGFLKRKRLWHGTCGGTLVSLFNVIRKYSNTFNKKLVLTPLNFKELNYLIPTIKGKEPFYKFLYNFKDLNSITIKN